MAAVEKQNLPDFALARFNMIEGQIRPNKVTDRRVLDRMGELPRELFVPPMMAGVAYKDEDLHVGVGRYLMEPMVLARLLQEAAIGSADRVLDIAPATGYSTAVIAALAKDVTGVESDPGLITQAVKNLTGFELANAEMQLGPLREGWTHKAPYNVILINGGLDAVPEDLFAQLAEGGRLLAVVRTYGAGPSFHTSEARLYEKIHGAISTRALFDANIKPLPGFQAPVKFTFT